MTLTRVVLAVLVLAAFVGILALVEVAARVWAGHWDARKVAAIAASMIALLTLMVWGWGA